MLDGGVTWTSRDCTSANNWTSAGGTTNGTVYASASLSNNFLGGVDWDVTTLVQAWVGGSLANRGLLVRRSVESSGSKPRHDFDSREGGTSPSSPSSTRRRPRPAPPPPRR
ncbi:MAG: DNRLRE domain-containing protein [Candidatus Binatia bacterium]